MANAIPLITFTPLDPLNAESDSHWKNSRMPDGPEDSAQMALRRVQSPISVGPACRAGLRGTAATSDESRSKGRPRGDVERMCDPRRFALRRKSFRLTASRRRRQAGIADACGSPLNELCQHNSGQVLKSSAKVLGIVSTYEYVSETIKAGKWTGSASDAQTETSKMSTVRINATISVADYLAGELVSNVKHEYISGAVFAMVGARNAHNMIAVNALLAFGTRLKGQTCRPFNSDTKIRIRISDHVRFYYPDMSVVCQGNALSDTFQDQPVVIVEVLSEGTRRLDDGEKRDAYFTIPSLTHYILLEQDGIVAVVYQRVGQKFERQEFTDIDDVITLDNLSLSLPLREFYDGVVSQ